MPEKGSRSVSLMGDALAVRSGDLSKEAPNVVTETQLKSLLRRGYHAEVVCRAAAYRHNAVWYGEWFIRAVNPENSVEKLLVPGRRRKGEEEITLRIFKTANGLISFLEGIGFASAHIPMQEGGRTVHVLAEGPSSKGS